MNTSTLPVPSSLITTTKTTTTSSSKLLRDLVRSFLLLLHDDDDDDDASMFTTTIRRHKTQQRNVVLLLDGGTGEELIVNGVPYDSQIWSARAIIDDIYHTTLRKVHTSFIMSGCDAITTNSYGIVPGVGFTKSEIAQYCSVAGQIAQSAVYDASTRDTSLADADKEYEYPKRIYILGSLGPLVESYRADNIMSRSDGMEYYTIMIQALHPYVDAFIAETLSSSEEAIQVLLALSNHLLASTIQGYSDTSNKTTTDVLFISFTVNTNGSLRCNENIITAISRVLDYHISNASNVQVLGILFNCSEPESITKALQCINNDEQLLHRLHSNGIALGAYANRLIPIPDSNDTKSKNDDESIYHPNNNNNDTSTSSTQPHALRTDLLPEQYYFDFVHDWVTKYNVHLIGGCCGITPAHMAVLHEKLKSLLR